MAMMMRFLISLSSPNTGIVANQLGAGLQAYLAYAAVPVGGEEEVHDCLQMSSPGPYRYSPGRRRGSVRSRYIGHHGSLSELAFEWLPATVSDGLWDGGDGYGKAGLDTG
jgi:hypothetical protein